MFNKSILVVGGSGFIGTNLLLNLAKTKNKIYSFDKKKPKFKIKNIKYINDNISRISKYKNLLKSIDFIVYLAAETSVIKSIIEPKKFLNNNINYLFHLIETYKKFNRKKIIFASSGGAAVGLDTQIKINENLMPYPKSFYGASKVVGENLLSSSYHSSNLQYISLRFSNIYGPYSNQKDSVVAKFTKNIIQNKSLEIFGDGKQTRDFIYVDDVVLSIIQAMKVNKNGIYNIGFGKSISLNDLVFQFKNILKKHNFIIKYKKTRKGEVLNSSLNIQKAKKDLKFIPTTNLEKGLRKTFEWFNLNHLMF